MTNTRNLQQLDLDGLYSNDEISAGLQVGNAGGIRVSVGDDGKPARAVVMTSLPSAVQSRENPYHDRIENGVLVYTAAGLAGDQALSGMNFRLIEQADNAYPIHGFQQIASRRDKSVGPRRWKYLGLLEYLRHYPENQLDTNGLIRSVWIIELGIHDTNPNITLSQDHIVSAELSTLGRFLESTSDDREVVNANDVDDLGRNTFTPEAIEARRSKLLGIEPQAFEVFISKILKRSGFAEVQTTKYSQDGGIDINAVAGPLIWPFLGTHLQVQAKRWHHTVGRKDVAELRGSLALHARGAVVTTSQYSRAAIAESKEDGKLPLVLVDGYTLAKITLQCGIDL